jgi:N-acetyl-alpha-D-muramate 1-phosphate uridylyltransferase
VSHVEALPSIAILAGGLATRLRPVTETIPKALIEIAGRPFIAWQLDLLRERGLRDAVICGGYLGEMIESAVGTGEAFGLRIRYSHDGPRLMGTGGAIRRALPLLSDPFYVVYGDSYLPCDYRAAAAAFAGSAKQALMTVFRNAGLFDSSNVEMDGDRIVVYDKRQRTPGMQHIDYGLGMFRQQAFSRTPSESPFDLAQLYQDLLQQGQLAAWEVAERFYENGSFEGIEELTAILEKRVRTS